MRRTLGPRRLLQLAGSIVSAAILGVALGGCAQPVQSCDSTPDPGAFDTTDVINRFSTGAGGSQSLGAGSNVNGPKESALGISACYRQRVNTWPPFAHDPTKPVDD
jgi:hypothetical protein